MGGGFLRYWTTSDKMAKNAGKYEKIQEFLEKSSSIL